MNGLVPAEQLDPMVAHVVRHGHRCRGDDGKSGGAGAEAPFMVDLVDEQLVPHPADRFDRGARDHHPRRDDRRNLGQIGVADTARDRRGQSAGIGHLAVDRHGTDAAEPPARRLDPRCQREQPCRHVRCGPRVLIEQHDMRGTRGERAVDALVERSGQPDVGRIDDQVDPRAAQSRQLCRIDRVRYYDRRIIMACDSEDHIDRAVIGMVKDDDSP
jgi:hypothetical protein